MYKKISRYMRIISIFTLVCAALAAASVCFSFMELQHGRELENAAKSVCFVLDECGADKATEYAKTLPYRILAANSAPAQDSPADITPAQGSHADSVPAHSAGIFAAHSAVAFAKDGTGITAADTADTLNTYRLHCAGIFALIALLTAMLAAVSGRVAAVLTENVIRPVRDISLIAPEYRKITEIYPELEPIIGKIRAQNHEIERQLLKLRRRKTRFQTVSENIGEGLLTLDTDGNILSINKSGTVILGVSEEEALHSSFAAIMHNAELTPAINKVLGGSKEFVTAMLDGRSYNIFFSPVYERDTVCGIVVLLLDVTERAATEKLRREFTANVSHELKTPLTTILGYSQIIGAGIAKPEDIKGFAEKIEKEASRLITLINDIIKLSKLDEHAPVQEPQPVDIKQLADDAAETLRISAKSRNIEITVEGESFTVVGNRVQLSELIFNLCDNAVKYNRDGGRVDITLHGRTLTVADTGIGIPEKYQSRIFERFFRVDKSRSKSVNGTGLGLSIVKHIAELYGAEITVESTIGEGTAIAVKF